MILPSKVDFWALACLEQKTLLCKFIIVTWLFYNQAVVAKWKVSCIH